MESCRGEGQAGMLRPKLLQFSSGGPKSAAARFRLFFLPTLAKEVFKTVGSQIAADEVILPLAKLHGANRSEVKRIGGHLDEVFRAGTHGKFDSALLPDLRDVVLPSLPHSTNKTIRPSQ